MSRDGLSVSEGASFVHVAEQVGSVEPAEPLLGHGQEVPDECRKEDTVLFRGQLSGHRRLGITRPSCRFRARLRVRTRPGLPLRASRRVRGSFASSQNGRGPGPARGVVAGRYTDANDPTAGPDRSSGQTAAILARSLHSLESACPPGADPQTAAARLHRSWECCHGHVRMGSGHRRRGVRTLPWLRIRRSYRPSSRRRIGPVPGDEAPAPGASMD